MFEILMYRYGALPQTTMIGIALGLMLLGGTIGLLTLKSDSRLLRSVYFFQLSAFTALFSASKAVWLLFVPAITGGYSGLILLVDLGGDVLFGLAVIAAALARSRDAYGHGRRAWLVFVPIANLFLLFTPSHDAPPTGQKPANLGAIVAGLVLAGLGRWTSAYIDQQTAAEIVRMPTDTSFVAAMRDLRIRADGIEAALDDQVVAEGAPYQVEPDLLLASLTRDGQQLRYVFVLDDPTATALNPDYVKLATTRFCGAVLHYLTNGATAHLRYVRPDGVELGTLLITLDACTT